MDLFSSFYELLTWNDALSFTNQARHEAPVVALRTWPLAKGPALVGLGLGPKEVSCQLG